MTRRTWPTFLIALIVAWGITPQVHSADQDGLRKLAGEWIYVEDRTEGRALEQLGPPMASKFLLGVEEGAVILNGHGSGHRDVRIALDGKATEVKEAKTISRYQGGWKDGTFEYRVEFDRMPGTAGGSSIRSIRRSFRLTPEGLIVSVKVDPSSGKEAVGFIGKRLISPCPRQPKRQSETSPGCRVTGLEEEARDRRTRSGGLHRLAERCSLCHAPSTPAARCSRSNTCVLSSVTAGWFTSRSLAVPREQSLS